MSKIGKKPILLPENVKVEIKENAVEVVGPKGKLTLEFPNYLQIVKEDGKLLVRAVEDKKAYRRMWGTIRAHLNNTVKGVTEGFTKTLILRGRGYQMSKEGNRLKIMVGFSHPVYVDIPDDIEVELPDPQKLIVKGIDKQKVGNFAAKIRAIKPAKKFPYVPKGMTMPKGFYYEGEHVRVKAGKKGQVGGK